MLNRCFPEVYWLFTYWKDDKLGGQIKTANKAAKLEALIMRGDCNAIQFLHICQKRTHQNLRAMQNVWQMSGKSQHTHGELAPNQASETLHSPFTSKSSCQVGMWGFKMILFLIFLLVFVWVNTDVTNLRSHWSGIVQMMSWFHGNLTRNVKRRHVPEKGKPQAMGSGELSAVCSGSTLSGLAFWTST